MAFELQFCCSILLALHGVANHQCLLREPQSRPAAATRAASIDKQLRVAAERGDIEQVRRLVSDGGELNPADPDESPLILAAAYRHRSVAEFLVLHGSHVNDCGRYGTALHWAAYTGDVELSRFLLDHGADLKIDSRAAGTPLHRATSGCNPEMVDLFIKRGANVNAAAGDNSTPLMWCILPSQYDSRARQVVRLLLDHEAEVNVTDKKGRTPLQLARKAGDAEILHLLLDHGAR